MFGDNLCDALCYNDVLFCDPYTVSPDAEVFIVIHMPNVLDPKLAPFNKYRVAFVPTTKFSSTTLGETVKDNHFVMNTVVVSTHYTETTPIQNIYGKSYGSAPCSKEIAECMALVTGHMWREKHGNKWRDVLNVVDVVGVVLYTSLTEPSNQYFIDLIKEMMTVSLWDAHTRALLAL